MKILIIALVLMILTPSVLAIQATHHENMTVSTLVPYEITLKIFAGDAPSQQVKTYFLSNNSVIIDGRIGGYHEHASIINNSWKDFKIRFTIYTPGTYTFYWGINLTKNTSLGISNSSGDVKYINITNVSDQFTIIASGNSSPINDSVGVNETQYYMKKEARYGTIANQTDVVKQRLAAYAASKNLTNTTNTTKFVTGANTTNNTKAVQNVSKPVVIRPSITNNTFVSQPPTTNVAQLPPVIKPATTIPANTIKPIKPIKINLSQQVLSKVNKEEFPYVLTSFVILIVLLISIFIIISKGEK